MKQQDQKKKLTEENKGHRIMLVSHWSFVFFRVLDEPGNKRNGNRNKLAEKAIFFSSIT